MIEAVENPNAGPCESNNHVRRGNDGQAKVSASMKCPGCDHAYTKSICVDCASDLLVSTRRTQHTMGGAVPCHQMWQPPRLAVVSLSLL